MKTQTLESTSMNVGEVTKEDCSKNEQMVERMQIESTPFTIISVDGKHFGVMGEYRMTEEKNSRGEVEDELKCITWNRIIQVMLVLHEIREKDAEFNNQINKSLNKKEQ